MCAAAGRCRLPPTHIPNHPHPMASNVAENVSSHWANIRFDNVEFPLLNLILLIPGPPPIPASTPASCTNTETKLTKKEYPVREKTRSTIRRTFRQRLSQRFILKCSRLLSKLNVLWTRYVSSSSDSAAGTIALGVLTILPDGLLDG
jgi:hypothetical protein